MRGVGVRLMGLVAAAALLCLGPPALALPQGEAVTHGAATFDPSGEGRLDIQQQTDKVIIEYYDFSIEQWETVRFIQPPDGAALNRVVGPAPSDLQGMLEGNAQVILINPNGIYIGQYAVINVRSFIASTLDLTDACFLYGSEYVFHGTGAEADVLNWGTIGIGGYADSEVYLIGIGVANRGTIHAPGGSVALISAQDDVHLATNSPLALDSVGVPSGQADNTGNIACHGGRVDIVGELVNQGGWVNADSLEGGPSGRIDLVSTHQTTLGESSVTSASGGEDNADGGTVAVRSSEGGIDFQSGAMINVAGGMAGGDGGFVEMEAMLFMELWGLMDASDAAREDGAGSLRIRFPNIRLEDGGEPSNGHIIAGYPDGDPPASKQPNGRTVLVLDPGPADDEDPWDPFWTFADVTLEALEDLEVCDPFVLATATGNASVRLNLRAGRHVLIHDGDGDGDPGCVVTDGRAVLNVAADDPRLPDGDDGTGDVVFMGNGDGVSHVAARNEGGDVHISGANVQILENSGGLDAEGLTPVIFGGSIILVQDLVRSERGDMEFRGSEMDVDGGEVIAQEGNVRVVMGGDFGVASSVSADAGNVTIEAGGAVALDGLVNAGGDIVVEADGAIQIDQFLAAGDDVTLRSLNEVQQTGGAINATGGVLIIGTDVSLRNVKAHDPHADPLAAGNAIKIDASGDVAIARNGLTAHDGGQELSIDIDPVNVTVRGPITATSDVEIYADGAVTVEADLTADSDDDGAGNLRIEAGDAVDLGADVLAGGDVTVEAGGDIRITHLVAGGTAFLTAGGEIVDTDEVEVDIVADQIGLIAWTGIGNDDAIEVDATGLAARTQTGDINIVDVNGGLNITRIGTLSGVAVIGGNVGDDISIIAQSPLRIGRSVTNTGGGRVMLVAQGASSEDDLTVDAPVVAQGGDGTVEFFAGDTVNVGADVSTSGDGGIVMTAGGDIILAAGIEMTSAGGDVALRASDRVSLGGSVVTHGGDVVVVASSMQTAPASVISTGGGTVGIDVPAGALKLEGGLEGDIVHQGTSVDQAFASEKGSLQAALGETEEDEEEEEEEEEE